MNSLANKVENLSIHLMQMSSKNNKEKNIGEVLNHLEKISLQKGEMVFLPENSLFMRQSQSDKMQAFDLKANELIDLQNFCKKKKFFLHLGAIPLLLEGEVYNTAVYINSEGEIFANYKKIHLFDVDIEGEKLIKESDAFKAGSCLNTFQYQGVLFGQSICYDLRFSNLYLAYAKLAVDVLLIPSAFFYVTGKDHWEILLRARAIESQAFVIAAAQGGYHGKQRTWGHSMVIDPWGKIIAEISETKSEPQSLKVEIDLSKILYVRKQIPMASHRKEDFTS